MLTGNDIEDLEAKTFKLHDEDISGNNFSMLVADSEVIVEKLNHIDDQSTFKDDLIDIVALYCLRKNVDYNPLFLQILTPLALSLGPSIPRTIISSSFYSLIDNFVPFLHFKVHFRQFYSMHSLFL